MKRFLVLGSVLAGSIAFLPNTTNAQMRGGTVIAPRMAAPAVVPHAVAPRPVAPRPAAHPVAGARLAAGAPAVAKSGAGTLRVRTVNGVTHIIVRRAAANLPRVASPVSPAGRLIHGSSGDMDQDDLPNFRTVPGLGFDSRIWRRCLGRMPWARGNTSGSAESARSFPFLTADFSCRSSL